MRLLLKETARLEAEVRALQDERRDLARRLRAHVPYEHSSGNRHAADLLELTAQELSA